MHTKWKRMEIYDVTAVLHCFETFCELQPHKILRLVLVAFFAKLYGVKFTVGWSFSCLYLLQVAMLGAAH